MELLFRQAVVGVVPQPTQVPPTPFKQEDLQRLYAEVTRDHRYQQFQLLPGDGGAVMVNPPADQVMVQPGLIQIQAPIELTPEGVREKIATIINRIFERLRLEHFLNCGIKLVAHVPAPGDDAKVFVSDHLMRGAEQADELGAEFFGGGVKFRRISPGREENLLIEPFIHDNKFIFIDYDVARNAIDQPLSDISQLPGWIDDAIDFARGPMMGLLEH